MIGRLKPPLDFYYAYGTWIVRYFPKHINQPGSVNQCKTWTAMKDAIDGWNDITPMDRVSWTNIVRNAMRTGKDFYYRCRLLDATGMPYNWKRIRVYAMQWRMANVRLWTKWDSGSQWLAWHCNQDEQHKTYYWKDEGFCIRGRRMVVKRHLIEQWEKSRAKDFLCVYPYICYSIPHAPNDTSIHVTFKRTGIQPEGSHGRTGVYIIRRPW